MELFLNNKPVISTRVPISPSKLLANNFGLAQGEYYLLKNGILFNPIVDTPTGQIHVNLRCKGGKGGFGSMLRAIGAQIEKTTNREACRDLSGRRLRDINEEQRLRNWIHTQAEREKETLERRKKKLEKMCEQPNHEFKDEEYDQARSTLPEIVEDAVTQGLKASCSTGKRKSESEGQANIKKRKLWFVEEELSGLSSENSDDENTTEDMVKKTIITEANNGEPSVDYGVKSAPSTPIDCTQTSI